MPSRFANSTPAISCALKRRFTIANRMGSARAASTDTSLASVLDFTPYLIDRRSMTQAAIVKRMFDSRLH